MARREAEAAAEPQERGRPYRWWKVADLKAAGFVDALTSAGPNARLIFREETELFTIEDPDMVTAQVHDGGFNFSHKCPPDCE